MHSHNNYTLCLWYNLGVRMFEYARLRFHGFARAVEYKASNIIIVDPFSVYTPLLGQRNCSCVWN